MKKTLFFAFLSLIFIFSFNIKDSYAASSDQFIIINKKINKLAFYEDGELVKTYDVATGKTPSLTPEGKFKIVNKIKNRPYYKKGIPGGSPKNPLGDRWLGINARGTWGDTYAMHGNNNEDSIGKYVSAGCVRMHNAEIRELFDKVSIDTPVVITNTSKGFDDIAISNGYEVGPKIEKYEKTITFFNKAKLYKEPRKSTFTGASLNPQYVYATERAGNYFKVKTWMGYVWAYVDDFVEGKPENLNTYITTFEKTKIKRTPNSPSVSALSPQKLYAYEKIGSHYKIKTWLGSYYISSNKVIEDVVQPFEGTITTYEKSKAFRELFGPAVTSFSPQELTAFEKIDRYYHINTYLGPLWVYH